MRVQASVIHGDDPTAFEVVIGMLRSLRPALLQHGIATAEELDIDAIIKQLQEEFVAERKVAISSLGFQAWARKP